MDKLRLAVLFGGRSGEHEVSLVSASSIIENIDRDKYEIYLIGITREGHWRYYEGPVEGIRTGQWEKDSKALVFPGDPAYKGFSYGGSPKDLPCGCNLSRFTRTLW